MKAIRENIVGLFKFSSLLFSSFILPRKRDEQGKPPYTDDDHYQTIVGQPTIPLVAAQTLFCPKCHVAVAQVRHTKQGTEIIQGGRVIITVGSNVIIEQDGKEAKGFQIRCPNGHTVRIE